MGNDEPDRNGDGEREPGSPRPRPKVVDKRISARQQEETPEPSSGGTQATASGASGPTTTERSPESGPSAATESPRAAAPAAESDAAGPTGSDVWTPEREAEALRIAQQVAETPSIEWVVNAAATLANVAQTKIELGAGRDAQLAIDALKAIVDGLGTRLQQAESPLRQTLAQLQLAYANAVTDPRPPGP